MSALHGVSPDRWRGGGSLRHVGAERALARVRSSVAHGLAWLVTGTCGVAGASAQAPMDTTTIMYESGGIPVIHRPSTGDIVVANLYLLGGLRQVTWANAGLELLLLEAGERGTRTYPRERLRRAMSRLGTSIAIQAESDWTAIGIRATRATLDSTWSILASRLMEPLLEPQEVELVRQQFVLGVRQRRDHPDALVEFLADSVALAGHPYAVPPSGTEASLLRITVEDLRRYQGEHMVKSRMLLVVVGSVTRRDVERLVTRTLAKLPVGTYTWSLPDTMPRRKASVLAVERQLPTNYIVGRFPGPKAGTQDYHALRIATAVLSGQLFGEIRSRRNLTYAVDAPFVDRAVSGGGFYVTTGSPQLTVDLMRQQLAAVRTGLVEEEALSRLVRQFLTQYYLENESNANQANALAKAHLFEGDFRALARFERNLRDVTPLDVQRAARTWIRDVQWAFVGDTTKVPRSGMARF